MSDSIEPNPTPDSETVENIPASILSDLERLDGATDILVGLIDDEERVFTIDKGEIEQILDSISDARAGLIYLVEKLNSLLPKAANLKPLHTGMQVVHRDGWEGQVVGYENQLCLVVVNYKISSDDEEGVDYTVEPHHLMPKDR